MIEFWLLCVFLLLLALLITVLPLLLQRFEGSEFAGSTLDSEAGRLAQIIDIFRQRLAELEAEQVRGAINETEFQSLRIELERILLADTDHQSSQRQVSDAHSNWRILVGLGLMLCVSSWAIYDKLGAIDDWLILQQMQAIGTKTQAGQPVVDNRQQLLDQLESRLRERPANVQYLSLLSRMYMAKEKYAEAALNYAKLAELFPSDTDVLGFYAQALYLSNNRSMSPAVQMAIDTALSLNPHQQTVLGIVGIDAYEKQDFAKAITTWQKIIDLLPPGSENATLLTAGIADAKSQLLKQGGMLSAKTTDKKVSESKVPADSEQALQLSVHISLSPQLSASANDQVFVFAKAAQGPPMPLAVQRLKVKDLPTTVTLDDSMAMMPQMKLSAFPKVIVIARISKAGDALAKAGDALAKAGDLQGVSGIIENNKAQRVALLIDTVVP